MIIKSPIYLTKVLSTGFKNIEIKFEYLIIDFQYLFL